MKTIDQKINRAYILHLTEVIESRPNLDPYLGSLRIEQETMQVRLSDVYVKAHIRRTFPLLLNNPTATFYQKHNPLTGEPLWAKAQLEALRKTHGITKEKQSEFDAMELCADTALFGYVHTAEKGESYHRNGAAQLLFWPSTFHSCKILGWGKSNAWCKEDGNPTGSATEDVLAYGVFLSLVEVDLNTLAINAKGSKIFTETEGTTPWVDLLAKGLWEAFDTQRVSSRTQKAHFSKAQVIWQPKPGEINPVNPLEAIKLLDTPEIHNWPEAEAALRTKVLPWLADNYVINKDTILATRTKRDYDLGEIFSK